MALLGNVVKKVLDLNQSLRGEGPSPAQAQRDALASLLSSAKSTAFGKFYDFEGVLQADDPIQAFRARVPLHTYASMHERWWSQQQQFPDITWPGQPEFYALSSGTTGSSSKRIPVTSDFLNSMRQVGMSVVQALPNYDLPESLFESEVLMLSSSADLKRHQNGHFEGEISGINISNFPGFYDVFYRPGKEIAKIDDWDQRVQAIAQEAPNWDIGAIAGIPSWVLLMLRKVMEMHGLNTIHELWPNLHVYASGGVAFETYRKDFEAITARPLVIMDTYLASEGFFAYTTHPGSMDMRLALDHGYYFEFIPFDERGVDETGQVLEQPEVFGIDQVELGQDYVLVVSSCAGAWRYLIGDTVKFTQMDPPHVVLTGRTKFFLNAVGSQLSEEKLDAGILKACNAQDASVSAYSVAALESEAGKHRHQWVIAVERGEVDPNAFAQSLDEALQESNKNYGVARNKALDAPAVTAISTDAYHEYLASTGKKGGQVKTPKVMTSEDMEGLLAFLA